MSNSVQPHRQQLTRLLRSWDSPGKNTGVGCHLLLQCMKVKRESEVTQSYLTLSDPMDCSPPGSSVHGIFQARVLEWVAISFSTGSSQIMDRTPVSCIGRWILYCWANREIQSVTLGILNGDVCCISAWQISLEVGFGMILAGTPLQESFPRLPGKSHGRRSLVGCSPWDR